MTRPAALLRRIAAGIGKPAPVAIMPIDARLLRFAPGRITTG
jgi:hypothetical protein